MRSEYESGWNSRLMATASACVLVRMSIRIPHYQLNATHLQRTSLGAESGSATMQVTDANSSLSFNQMNQSSYPLTYKITLNSFQGDRASTPIVCQTVAGTQHHPHLLKKRMWMWLS